MVNKNYVNGVNFERQLVNLNKLKKNFAMRSAGSRGAADVLVIDMDGIHALQCKTFQMTRDDIADALYKFLEYKEVFKRNKIKCILMERYNRQRFFIDVTNLVYE